MPLHQSSSRLSNQVDATRRWSGNLAAGTILRMINRLGALLLLGAAYTILVRDPFAIIAVALYCGLLFNGFPQPAKGQASDDEGTF